MCLFTRDRRLPTAMQIYSVNPKIQTIFHLNSLVVFFSFTNNFKSSSTFLNSCSIFIIVLKTIYAFTFFEVDSDKLFHGAISFRPLHKLHFVLFKSWNNLKIKIKCEIIWNLFFLDRVLMLYIHHSSNFQRRTGFCFGESYSTETFGE